MDEQVLGAFATTPGYHELLALFDSQEEALRDILYTAASDEDSLRRLRYWQTFRHFTNILRTPELIAEKLKQEIENLLQHNSALDPLAPRTRI